MQIQAIKNIEIFNRFNLSLLAGEPYFVKFNKSYFSGGLKKLKYRWTICIVLKEDDFEK